MGKGSAPGRPHQVILGISVCLPRAVVLKFAVNMLIIQCSEFRDSTSFSKFTISLLNNLGKAMSSLGATAFLCTKYSLHRIVLRLNVNCLEPFLALLQKPVLKKPSTTLGELENSGLLRWWAQRS